MLSIRKIGLLGRTYRHLSRYRRILGVLFKYGFGDLVERLHIDQYVEIGLQVISKKRRKQVEKLTRAERIRLALEELGPTYVKLGQVLSTRPDLIAAELIQELTKLQDEVPPFGFEEVRRIIETELAAPVEDCFAHFDSRPRASASIAQVHQARLPDGESVAVKIRRPGIRRIVEVDLEIMLHLATLMERHVEELAFYRPVKIVEEFARTLEKELDFTIEASHMNHVARNFLDDSTLYVPKVFHELTTSQVLTTEFVEGIKISAVDQLDAKGLDRSLITRRGADVVLKMVFEHGFFHADPHPGNIFVLSDEVICLVDFGMVGRIDRRTREQFVELVDGILRRDPAKTMQAFLMLTTHEQEPDLRLLEREVGDFMLQHFYKPLKEIDLGRLLHELLEVATRHGLRIPADTFLMMKALSAVETIARTLSPDFDIFAAAAPYITKVRLARYSPQRITDDTVRLFTELLQFVRQFPRDLLEISRQLRQQRLNLQLEHQGLERMLATQDQTSNRLAFAIVIAALVIGSALIVISETPPFFFGISLIGIIGFFAAAIMGIWLLVAILRSGRL